MPEIPDIIFLDIMRGLFSADKPDQSDYRFRGYVSRHNPELSIIDTFLIHLSRGLSTILTDISFFLHEGDITKNEFCYTPGSLQ